MSAKEIISDHIAFKVILYSSPEYLFFSANNALQKLFLIPQAFLAFRQIRFFSRKRNYFFRGVFSAGAERGRR